MGLKTVKGGITAPLGYRASGLYCGIKQSKRKDLALIVSEVPCDATGVFTTNKVQASCVVINKEHLKNGRAQAVVVNSGNANCMTGESGFDNSRTMASQTARILGVRRKDVLVASTGVIGKPLPIRKIVAALPELVRQLDRRGSEAAATAILTTDKRLKEIAVEFRVGRRKVRVGAIAKGAGMIHPQMVPATGPKHATMLCFVTTDAAVTLPVLRSALERAVNKTFNRVSIDGDMSTNDMVVVLANGLACNTRIVERTPEARLFQRALEAVFAYLSKQMILDAEGATKFVEVEVRGAASDEDATRVARSVATSNLFKCALFGSDPNWGRIAAAAGYSGAQLDPWKLQIFLGKELVVKNGGRVKKSAAALNRVFARKDIRILLDLGLGSGRAEYRTCDLSTNYVRINSAYRT
ncbi:MAG: Arginine biosynthesis bifunctional protein ArgJ [Candidatus Omnitrophica bacterium]|nr:Arginine biosynthesis bifunctional protein ArgJ [Candidatus Omnitrophota bacterium]